MASKVVKQPYVNIQVNGLLPSTGASANPPSIPKPHPLTSHNSEPCINVGESPSVPYPIDATPKSKATTLASSRAAAKEADVKFKLLVPGGDQGECQQCQELSQLLALWELGVGGIARNCSKILAQLNQAREAHQALDFRLKEKAEIENSVPAVAKSLNATRAQKVTFRKSMYAEQGSANNSSNGTAYLAEQMYPAKESELRLLNNCTDCVSLPYEHYLQSLNTHLGQAIDLCQQLAAACFKSNQSVTSSTSNTATVANGDTPRLRRQPTAPTLKSTRIIRPPTSPVDNSHVHQPPLDIVPEDRTLSKRANSGNFKRTSSSPSVHLLECSELKHADSDSDLGNKSRESERLVKTMISSSEVENGWVKVAVNGSNSSPPPDKETETENSTSKSGSFNAVVSSRSSLDNPLLSVLGVTEQKKLAKEAARDERDDYDRLEFVLSSSSTGSEHMRDSILSTYSDSDVKQVMSKIAGLEEERIRLLDTIDKLHQDNQLIHQSLGEVFSDLQSKDLQLTLAMQDLSIATEEIKQAAEFRSRLDHLEKEKAQLSEHLGNLEDESAAVKVSLIRLLQEKSATNKTLALENWRLTQRMRQLSAKKLNRHGPNGATSPASEGDNVSMASGFSTFNEDAGLQEAYIGFDDSGHFVHKQGFLIKQGAKVKSWKRRLFVLNTDGLAYFKTEQPIQTIPLDKIDKVQVCHGRTPQPNMFEVHTQGRVFMLSAPSEDEMQSWVGMLQTLKQYNKVSAQAQLQSQALAQAQIQSEAEGKALQRSVSQSVRGKSTDARSSEEDSSQLHRDVVQWEEEAKLEPVNLPQIQGHQPLTQITSGSFQNALRDALSESEEPSEMKSVPNTPARFDVDSPCSPKSDIIASLNLQVYK